MARKKKRLPKDFQDRLKRGEIAELKAVFDSCMIDARGGYGKQTALAFDECSDEFSRWLVDQGADLSAGDTWGRTPLHNRAMSPIASIGVLLELGADVQALDKEGSTPLHSAADAFDGEKASLLIGKGALVDARNRSGLTPLELALQRCSNIDLIKMADLAQRLLAAGADRTPKTKKFVERIGKDFEFHRSNFNRKNRAAHSDALDRLYGLFEVPPVPRLVRHDGKADIVVEATAWQAQHEELWRHLVPSSGPAKTVQGELIRISGRIAHELEGNGGMNWDADYRKMADAFLDHVKAGNPLPASDLSEAAEIVKAVKARDGDTARMAELAVKWVLQNPKPAKLPPPAYKR